VNIYLKKIIELSEIDNEISNFEPRIEAVKKSYENINDGKEAILKEIKTLNGNASDTKKKIASCEKEIANARKKQKDNETKLKTVTKEKEITALSVESNMQKTTIEFNNDEIVKLGKIVEKFEEQIKKKEEELNLFEDKTVSAEQEMENKLRDLANEEQKIRSERIEMIANIKEKKLITFYDKIRRWAGETTVVPVKKGACFGCFIKLADQKYLEVIQGEEIITCPNCGRILYLENEELEKN
jgi:predicted  nucleic acid-binding Zn-ribbon protein